MQLRWGRLPPDVPSETDMMQSARVTRRVLVTLAGLLVLAAAGIALWQLWPETSWTLGLVDESWNYASAAPEAPSGGQAIPEGRRLVIPRIAVDVPITQGNPDRALSLGVYHHPEGASPGEGSSTILAGHRNRRALALLSRLEKGDPVLVYWDGVEHIYRVDHSFVITPDNTSVLEPSDTEELRMYTCLPRFLGNKRTVVVALPE